MKKKWTVILLYPLSGDDIPETFVGYAEHPDPYRAVDIVRRNAQVSNPLCRATDFLPLAVIEGEHVLRLGVTDFT